MLGADAGADPIAALTKQGYIRKAAPGAYQVDSLDDPTIRRNLENVVNADLAEIRRPTVGRAQQRGVSHVYVDTNQVNAAGEPIRLQIPVPPEGIPFRLGADTPTPEHAMLQYFRAQTPEQENWYAAQVEREVYSNPGRFLAKATSQGDAEADTLIAATDQAASDLRRQMLNGATTGEIPEINTQFTVDAASALSERYQTISGVLASQAMQMQMDTVKNLPKAIQAKFLPGWATNLVRTANGGINRNPAAWRTATTASNYIHAQRTPVAMAMHDIDRFVKQQFGEVGERISIRPDAPNDVKIAFKYAQDGKYGNAAIGIIAENPQHFNLTPQQSQYMSDLQFLMEYDARLGAEFGVDTSYLYVPVNRALADAKKSGDAAEIARLQTLKANGDTISGVKRVDNYARHMVEMVGPEGKALDVETRARLLGSERSFQKHRMLDQWTDVIMSAADPENFRARITAALRGAVDDGDLDEAERLRELFQSGTQVSVRRASFSESVGERLAQSARQRGEAMATRGIRELGGDIRAEEELKSLLNAARIPDVLKIPAEAAGFIRSLQLRADFSLLGVQSWGAFAMGRGMNALGTLTSPAVWTDDAWARYRMLNADKMNLWQMHDLSLNETLLELPDDLDILRRKQYIGRKNLSGTLTTRGTEAPWNYLTDAVQYMDKVQFSRMAASWKLDMADHTLGLLRAARDGHLGFDTMLTHPSLGLARIAGTFKGQTDAQLMRAASSFTNNLFGGLNATAQGRSAIHSLVENIFVLTPGFTRGTVSIGLQAGNLFKWGPEAVLARDFAVRGTILAGAMVKGLTMALNSADEDIDAKVNVTDPSRDDWMVITLADGKTIRPLSRWRGTAALIGGNIDTLMKAGPIEAGAAFGSDTLRWATYRQSGLVTDLLGDPVGDIARGLGPVDEMGQPKWANAGNVYARDMGLLNLLTNPQADPMQQLGRIALGNAPIAGAAGAETALQGGSPNDVAFALGMELLGVGQTSPTKMETTVRSAGGEITQELGVPEDVVRLAIANGDNPIYAKDELGNYLLPRQQREDAIQRVAAATGIPEDIVRQNGRANAAQRQEVLAGIKDAQLDNYHAGVEVADRRYAEAMAQADQAAKNGMPLGEVSKFISDARTKRFEAKQVVEEVNPLAIAFMRSPEQMAKQHSFDDLMSAISSDAYSKDFFDPATLSFDFDARDRHYNMLAQKYGGAFDIWQEYQDRNKTPLERARDNAFDRLGVYFRVEDEIWQRATGGALGATEKEFDRTLTEQLQSAGVADPGMRAYLISQIKQNLKPVTATHTYTTKVRNLMRASDPILEQDVTTWLGAQPIALKELSRRDRALVNSLLVQAD